MIVLDGAEGGGQLVRTALGMAALSNEPIRMERVRGARSSPGLRPQHLACLEIFKSVCAAEVEGAAVGSEAFEFHPQAVHAGNYVVDIGTAGSIPLLFDAALPVGLELDSPLTITAHGGTDVAWAPPLTYQSRVKLPLLGDHGLIAAVDRRRPGFYPAGGGRARLRIGPSTLDRFDLPSRTSPPTARVYSLAGQSLADQEVAERQATTAVDSLERNRIDVCEHSVMYAPSDSPGSVVVIELETPDARAGVTALGEQGKAAETVAQEAVDDTNSLLRSAAQIDRHLADQLVVPVALAGGQVALPAVTDHVRTAVDLVNEFGVSIRVEAGDPPALVAPGTEEF